MPDALPACLDISSLNQAYRIGRLTPSALVDVLARRLDAAPDRKVWIARLSIEAMLAYARVLDTRSPDELPLYGIPFAIKDNIDLAGVPTTAACPAFGYLPERSAFAVERLIEAGAIPVGKTNLDQFATGLVGVRSPYGACRNSFDPDYIAGGSSSGSAVAVATGLVSFALGTDTAGSGRVPAAFNNLVGVKPTHGLVSASGVVPACRSLDCVSLFALTAADAERVLRVLSVYDAADPYARKGAERPAWPGFPAGFRVGVPAADQLEFFGDEEAERLFRNAVEDIVELGGQPVTIDFQPFAEAARLLYEGPWVAERYRVVRDLLARDPGAVLPVTREIIGAGAAMRAADAWDAFYRLRELKRATEMVWDRIDVLLTPTAGTIYRIAEIEADPIRLNSRLGYYTNFMNLLDLAAVAVPAGFRGNGLPFGVTLCAPAFSDALLLGLARFRAAARPHPLGAGGQIPSPSRPSIEVAAPGYARVAVCGAHLSGLPLNPLLTRRGGRLVRATRTAPCYRLYALPDGKRPGLVRDSGGAAIEVEIWELPLTEFGGFVAEIPPPLGIGTLELADGAKVQGFLCEAHAVENARDITEYGGWLAYLTRPS